MTGNFITKYQTEKRKGRNILVKQVGGISRGVIIKGGVERNWRYLKVNVEEIISHYSPKHPRLIELTMKRLHVSYIK